MKQTFAFCERAKLSLKFFSTTEKDRQQVPSKLHEFLEDIGLSRVDAHMICSAIEGGNSISGIFALK